MKNPYNPKSSYALTIGVGKRPEDHEAMEISALDAKRLSEELLNRCPLEKENVKSLVNEGASLDGVLATLDEYILKTAQDPADMFLFYFSGHGYVNNGKYYLICRDTKNTDIANTALDAESFMKKLQAINTDKMVVFLDCCHSAGMTKTDDNPLEKEAFLSEKPNRIVLAASHAEQVSFLSKPVSIFTYALIKGLAGSYFQSTDKDVTIFDLAMYVRELVYPLSRNKQQPQLNVLEDSKTSNFSLVHYPDGRPEGLVFEERFKLLDANGKEINTELDPQTDEPYREKFKWLKVNKAEVIGDNNIVIQDVKDSNIEIQTGDTTNQEANKIYNIDNIDEANFS